MAAIKHYGIADLYDPDRPTAEDSAVSRIDALALGRNVRAWMRVRAQSKTPNKTVTEVITNRIILYLVVLNDS